MSLALLCSGQGRQARGMFALFDGADAAQPVFDAAASVLGADPRALVAEADEATLHNNRIGQILCVTRALAAAACLELDSPLLIAGYSVGEMAAWGVAGLWSAEETIRLTAIRAELMDQADSGGGGLGFIRGLDRKAVEPLVADHRCAIAIANPDRLFVIGGARADVAACCAQALVVGAASARPLAVNVASHTPRLSSAVEPFEAVLSRSVPARIIKGRTLLGASDGAVVYSLARGAPGLARQLAHTVDWAGTLAALVERGADRIFELGPGGALRDMMRGAYPTLPVRALDDFQTLAGARAWLTPAIGPGGA
ncbi:acyltransferase domain-containing protein [Caulobacter sp. S45]|uniref:acyltransferase domain-containing protein n=1 Tax=Caulobacter sp. S45 TaxID=1641861 RepID=UPI00131EB802|nr:acyltransferase domain-containing protein [Caulobacter sp. S45]